MWWWRRLYSKIRDGSFYRINSHTGASLQLVPLFL